MTVVKMPQLGETVIEGTILKWLKQEGDQVALDEPLFEISTDKVDTEVPSSAAGVLAKIMVRRARRSRSARSSPRSPTGGRVAPELRELRRSSLRTAPRKPRPRLQPPVAPMLPPLRHHPLLRRAPPAGRPRRSPLRRRRLRRRLRIGGLAARSCRRSFGSWRRSTASISRR